MKKTIEGLLADLRNAADDVEQRVASLDDGELDNLITARLVTELHAALTHAEGATMAVDAILKNAEAEGVTA